MTNIQNDIIIYNDDIEQCIYEFFRDKTDDDIIKESMSRWNCCLIYIYNHLYKGNKRHSKYNTYSMIDIDNMELIDNILSLYLYYSMYFCKEISVFGFSLIIGYDVNIIYRVYNDSLVSTKKKHLLEKVKQYRHESLKSLLLQGGKTQFGATVILNHDFDYNLPGSNRDVVERRQFNKSEIAEQLGVTLNDGISDNTHDKKLIEE